MHRPWISSSTFPVASGIGGSACQSSGSPR